MGLLQLLQGALVWAHVGQGDYGNWYEVVRWLASTLFLYLLVGSVYLPFLYHQHVDPHFLCNNLNILSALIEPANEAALDYVSHLASLYRYLVRAGQREVVPVAEELAFARDYQFLLQRRFGVAYRFEEDVQLLPESQAERLLPPGVLQELLTNAVKHNLASRQHPLLIRLTLTPDALRLEHPRRPRPVPAPGTGNGLPGLRARLALLTDQPLVIDDTPTTFAVTVPLLSALPTTPTTHAPAAAGR